MNKKLIIGIALAVGVVSIGGAKLVNDIKNKNVKPTESINLNDVKISKKSEDLKTKIIKIAKVNNIEKEKSEGNVQIKFVEAKENQIIYTSEISFPAEGIDTLTSFIVNCKVNIKDGEKASIDLNKGFIGDVTEEIVGEKVDLNPINEKINNWINTGDIKNSKKTLRKVIKVNDTTITLQETKDGGFIYEVIKE